MLSHKRVRLLAWALSLASPAAVTAAERVVAHRAEQAPTIDGRADDAGWPAATSTTITVEYLVGSKKGKTFNADMKVAFDDDNVYVLIRWPDSSRDVTHKQWTWDEDEQAYVEGWDLEDVVSLAFPIRGPFTGDMVSGKDQVWDVWQWKAARTNPAGYAMDKRHFFYTEEPSLKAAKIDKKDGSVVWIRRVEDSGDSPQRSQPAPKSKGPDHVAKYVPGTPSGSAADVRAKGVWADGTWTVEMARALNTGHDDDAAFSSGATLQTALALFNHSEDNLHAVSEVFELVLGAP